MPNKVTMAAFSPKSNVHSYNVRSISFPARSHPNVRRLEEKLNKLSSFGASSPTKVESICNQLSGLGETYRCVQDLLNLPLTQQAVEQREDKKWASDMLDDLIRYLDVCGSTRDAMLLMKGSVRELRSAIRRSKLIGGELIIESNVRCYNGSRKEMKKDMARYLTSLKKQKHNYFEQPTLPKADRHLSAVGRVCGEVSLVTTSIFESLLQLLSLPTILKPQPVRWSLVSKLTHRGAVACEDQQEIMVNGLESVDAALNGLLLCNPSKDAEPQKMESAQKKLDILEIRIEEIENELECLFRQLIRTRVALLNMLSHKFIFL